MENKIKKIKLYRLIGNRKLTSSELFLMEKLDGMKPNKNVKPVFVKNNIRLFSVYPKTKHNPPTIYVNYYHIWSVLEREYKMNYNNIQTILNFILKQYINCDGYIFNYADYV